MSKCRVYPYLIICKTVRPGKNERIIHANSRVQTHACCVVCGQDIYSDLLHTTFADAGIEGDSLRREVYGQEDHVRLYGRDIFDRFASAGFQSLVVTHQQVLSDIAPEIYGVSADEPLFLFEAI